MASSKLREPIEEKHLTELGDRVQTLPNGKLLIPKFITFQFGALTDNSLIHRSVLKALTKHGIPYPIPIPLQWDQVKVKVKVKEKEKEKDQFPDVLNTDRFKQAWTKWQNHRREIKKPLTPTSITEQLRAFQEMGESRAIAAIEHTVKKGWQGIIEPSTGGPQKTTHQPLNIKVL